jgi:hypothetical protein
VFVLDPQLEAILAVDIINGAIKFQLPAVGCNRHYNCGTWPFCMDVFLP